MIEKVGHKMVLYYYIDTFIIYKSLLKIDDQRLGCNSFLGSAEVELVNG